MEVLANLGIDAKGRALVASILSGPGPDGSAGGFKGPMSRWQVRLPAYLREAMA